MTICDGRTHNVHVRDVVHLLDDSQYRILEITPPPGPVILKKTNHSTYRSPLRAPSQLFISAPGIVNQSTETDSKPTDNDDPISRDILQCCGPAAVEAYHRGRPKCIGDIHFVDLPKRVNDVSV